MMVARNEFRAHRLVELTLLVLLLLSPLEETHAIDSTLQNKVRGKDNDLVENISPEDESIDSSVIHVPSESDSIGLSTGEEESSQEVESIATKSNNVLKNDFFEQAKKASKQSLSMTLTSDTGLPNGEDCDYDWDCESGRCDYDYYDDYYYGTWECVDKLPNGEDCRWDINCKTGRCVRYYYGSGNFECKGLRDGNPCDADWKCESGSCDGTCYTPSCFSSTSMVNHMIHGLAPISDINIGDYIQSNTDGSFSRVYAFEKNHDGKSEFLQIHSSTDTLLELTDRHMLYLKNKQIPIPAGQVRVGDILETIEDPGAQVEKIEIIQREGYYAPHTEDGTIIVNNIMTSSYSTAKSSAPSFLYGDNKVLSFQNLVNIGLSPLRFTCKAVWFGFCSEEKFQDENGFHMYIVFLDYFSGSPILIQLIFYPIVFGMGVMFSVLELFYDQGEAFYKIITSSLTKSGSEAAAQDDGSFGFLFTFSLTVAALVPSAIFLWRKKYHLSCD